jgi:pimeloyl-ACP methyl ester carboxylesterase
MPTPLVLVPGLLCDRRLWSHQVAYLSDVADPVVTAVPASGSVGGMARDVLQRAPETFALAGLSMGGYVAFEIMRQAPERVTALALLDTSARADTREQTQARLELLRLAEAGRFAEVPRLLLPRILQPARIADEDLISTVVGKASAVGPEAFERQERAIMARPDSRGDLASIGCPTLVLCGREDELTPPCLHKEMAEHIPGAQLHVVDECGHLSTLERPAQVNEALRDWLEQSGR